MVSSSRCKSVFCVTSVGKAAKIGLAAVAGVLLAAPAAHAACETRVSRLPMAMSSPVPPGAAFRASMARAAPVAVAAPRPRAKARPAKARPAAHRARRPGAGKKVAHARRAKAPAAAVASVAAGPIAPRRAPFIAPAAVATPDAAPTFALIESTICESGVASGAPVIPLPRAAMARGGQSLLAPADVRGPAPGGEGGFVIVTGPPIGPGPGGPGPFLPPILPPGPPVGLPGAVPEPGAWALMILGFGAVGWRLRRRAAGGTSRPLRGS